MITQEKLKHYLTYNPETGIFTRNISVGASKKGSICGYKDKNGRLRTKLEKFLYDNRKLAWLYVYGVIPEHINSINRNIGDARIENLKNDKNIRIYKNRLTNQTIENSIIYIKETGLVRKIDSFGNLREVKTKDKNGYLFFNFNRKKYTVHRVVWFYENGEWPELLIDHINGIKTDNRIENLRLATISQNLQNQRKSHKDCKSGMLGVYQYKDSGKYFSTIMLNGKSKYLGSYETPELAHEAYLKAKRELHEFCTI